MITSMRFRAGTTHSFQVALSSYTGAGWVVKLLAKVNGDAAPTEVVLTESNLTSGCWSGEITPETSTGWTPGCYSGTIIAEKDGAKYVAKEFDLIVLPNPFLANGKTANQLELEKVEAAINAVLDGKGVKSHQIQTNIGTRQLERMSLDELRKHRNWLEGRVTAELVKMGLKSRSASNWRNIGVRFKS